MVALDEPDVDTTVTMLRGLRQPYERSHGVLIRDDALIAAAEMGARYIAGRHHPDKGIDLVDTAAARVKVALRSKPASLQDIERSLQELDRTIAALEREVQVGGSTHQEAIAAHQAEREELQQNCTDLTERWQTELKAAHHYLQLRDQLLASQGIELGEASNPVKTEANRDDQEMQIPRSSDPETTPPSAAEVSAAREAFIATQDDDGLVSVEVTAETVAKVVADWTGIPVGNMVKDQAAALLSFETIAKDRVKGQDHVMDVIGTGLRAAGRFARSRLTARCLFIRWTIRRG